MPKARRGLLALDTSTHVGWAYFAGPLVRPICGTWHAPKAKLGVYGPRFHAFRLWLNGMLSKWQPAMLAFESPFDGFPGHTTRLLIGFAAVAEEAATAFDVPCIEFPPASVKVRLAGHGRADAIAMKRAARALGFAIEDDHQADACGVGLLAFDHIAITGTPGFDHLGEQRHAHVS